MVENCVRKIRLKLVLLTRVYLGRLLGCAVRASYVGIFTTAQVCRKIVNKFALVS